MSPDFSPLSFSIASLLFGALWVSILFFSLIRIHISVEFVKCKILFKLNIVFWLVNAAVRLIYGRILYQYYHLINVDLVLMVCIMIVAFVTSKLIFFCCS